MTTEDKKTFKRLSSAQRDMVESELYSIFQEIDFKDILEQMKMLRDLKEELKDVQMVLESAKCCLEKVCGSRKFFCC